ncbi:hypothetical protein M080_4415, partial [Bacteroides fragilis str. 3397 T10]
MSICVKVESASTGSPFKRISNFTSLEVRKPF